MLSSEHLRRPSHASRPDEPAPGVPGHRPARLGPALGAGRVHDCVRAVVSRPLAPANGHDRRRRVQAPAPSRPVGFSHRCHVERLPARKSPIWRRQLALRLADGLPRARAELARAPEPQLLPGLRPHRRRPRGPVHAALRRLRERRGPFSRDLQRHLGSGRMPTERGAPDRRAALRTGAHRQVLLRPLAAPGGRAERAGVAAARHVRCARSAPSLAPAHRRRTPARRALRLDGPHAGAGPQGSVHVLHERAQPGSGRAGARRGARAPGPRRLAVRRSRPTTSVTSTWRSPGAPPVCMDRNM